MNATTANNPLIFAQTDTTAGFLCKDYKKINRIKKRDLQQSVLCEIPDFATLKTLTRIPLAHKKIVRKMRKTTFIYPNQRGYRVVAPDLPHHRILRYFGVLYSSSANIHNKDFQLSYALRISDIVAVNSQYFSQKKASKILKLGRIKVQKLR
ncbi:MAG: Sua5 YciO YrdC YwlC family protein [Helicobacter sp.]|nr:Sua5 YciO YrdC YwlC family protein [Helicobacter sp.]